MKDPLAGLQAGQMSPVFSTRFGCNVLLLAERRAYQPVSYEEAREKLRKELFDKRMEEEYAAFLETLRQQTYVERKGVFAGAAPSLTGSPGQTD
jgi:peptidyl-prolyl cis-trans isomerase SurA